MATYRPAGQDFYFPYSVQELEPYKIFDTHLDKVVAPLFPRSLALSSHTVGLVGGDKRDVECWSAPPGLILKVSGGSDFYVAPSSQAILRMDGKNGGVAQSENLPLSFLSGLDCEILVGPVLVLALAQRDTFCLHASAAMFRENVIVFLGESGQGKSTLAAYLSQCGGWRLVADDILPVRIDVNTLSVSPHFPQLKLPMDAQPGPSLPEKLPLSKICLLMSTENNPELQQLPTNQAVQVWLSHTAGTRLFDPGLLVKHLDFCTQAAAQPPVYRLAYPHNRDALPAIRDLLESIC